MIKLKDIQTDFNLLGQKLKILSKLKYQTAVSLTGLIVAITVFIIISHIAFFELSFDKFHKNYHDVYRVTNTRIYQNLVDASAGCPPATGPTIKEEIPEIMYSTRIKLLPNSVIEIDNAGEKNLQYHNNLFYADNTVFHIFSFNFIAGNPENALSDVNTAVVTKSFGKKYFGKENVLGEKFKCSNSDAIKEFTIKGVIEDIPANSYLNMDCLLSYPTLARQDPQAIDGWGWNAFNTFVRLKPHTDAAVVNEKLKQVVVKYNLSNETLTRVFLLQPIDRIHLHSNLRQEIGKRANAFTVYILIAIAVFTLLIAWINYINLSTAKSRKQYLEIYIRQILGNTRRKMTVENIFETLLLNIVAFNVSFILIELSTPWLKNYLQLELHPLGITNWIIIIATCTIVSILAGMYATSIIYSKRATQEITYASEKNSMLLRNGLVVFQFTISIVFIIVSIFVVRQIRFLETKQKELSIDNVITISAANIGEAINSQKAFLEEVTSSPGIEKVSTSSSVPGGTYTNVAGSIRPLGVNAEDGIKCSFIEVNDHFFDLYNIKIIGGENFKNTREKNEGRIILNSLAAKMLGYNNPAEAINQKLIIGEQDNQIQTVIGVVQDYHQRSLQEPIQPMIFNYQEYGGYISVRYNNELSGTIASNLKTKWEKIFSDQPFDYYFDNQYYSALYDKDRLFSRMVGMFAFLIIFISCIGLYSLAQFAINKRIKEIGVRKVNGASTGNILLMLNKDFTQSILLAFIVSCPFAWYALKLWLNNYAYHTQASWWIFAASGVIALIIALLTISLQAYRAANRNPVEALRYE